LRRNTCAKIEKGYLQIQQGYQDEGGRKGPMRRKSMARHEMNYHGVAPLWAPIALFASFYKRQFCLMMSS
jgi:hypothetical protein